VIWEEWCVLAHWPATSPLWHCYVVSLGKRGGKMKQKIMILVLLFGMLLVPAAFADELTVRGPAVPTSGDINGDGRPDLAIGSGDGRVYLAFQSPGTSGEPQYTKPLPVLIGGRVLDVGDYASPVLIDLNNDGQLDLLLGNAEGRLSCHYNIGSPTRPVFSDGVPLMISNEPATIMAPEIRGINSPYAAPASSAVSTMPPQPAINDLPPAPSEPAVDNLRLGPPPVLPPPVVVEPVVSSEPARIAVIDFANEVNVVDLEWLAQGVPDILVLSIPATERHQLLPRERFQNKTLNLANIDEVFHDADFVIKGNYRLEGDDLVIETVIVDMEAIDIVESFYSRGSRGNVFPIINQLEQELGAYFADEFDGR